MMLCSLAHPGGSAGTLSLGPFPACALKGDAWDILAGQGVIVVVQLSSPTFPTFHDIYCCCTESTCDVGLALNPTGPVLCWGGGCSPFLVTPDAFGR